MIVIPVKPISTNQLFQGRRFKTRDYNKFIEAALYFAPKIKMIKGIVQLRVDFYIKQARKSDLDNFLKGTLDLITKAGYIEDNRFIYKIIARKFKSDNERIELKIKAFNKAKLEKINEQLTKEDTTSGQKT